MQVRSRNTDVLVRRYLALDILERSASFRALRKLSYLRLDIEDADQLFQGEDPPTTTTMMMQFACYCNGSTGDGCLELEQAFL